MFVPGTWREPRASVCPHRDGARVLWAETRDGATASAARPGSHARLSNYIYNTQQSTPLVMLRLCRMACDACHF